MSVLIRGMEKPEECYCCPCSTINMNGRWGKCNLLGRDYTGNPHKIYNDCPLVDIPDGFQRECEEQSDNVNHPSHYELEGLGVEVIDVIRSILGSERFCGYCKGNVIKYILRADKKNHLEDLEKARVYLNWLIETCKTGENEDEDKTR